MRLRRRLLCFTALTAVLLPGAALSDDDTRYDNTYHKDFVMDAPWRVVSDATAIPITVILKDCDTDDIRELHWIRCLDVTSGSVVLWHHDFGDERIGDDVYESNFWTYVTTVTEGHPSLPDGTPLTPANLGYGSGDSIDLEVSVYYRDTWFNYTETRRLRVHVAVADYPWPDGWYGGDTHYHTMYTNNTAEFGAPLPAVAATAKAMGLQWLITTDHSCDLDETGDGAFSYATTHWEYTIQDQTGTQTSYRDNTAIGSTWDVLGSEATLFSSQEFRIHRGVELNAASVDSDTYGKTLHCLVVNDAYISSPLSGAIGERPVTPSLPDALAQIQGGGFAYAAHPLSDMSAEWGGLDWTINGAAWGDEDYAAALGYSAFSGLEAFNTRATRYSSDQNDPWPDFDAGVEPGDPYPAELLAGIDLWDAYLRSYLPSTRKIFLSGGSDAHGDFNYGTFLSLDSYATDNAIGKVQTVVRVPDPAYGPGNLPPTDELVAACRDGRSVVTDGPFIEIGIDRNGDGDFDDAEDVGIGGDTSCGSVESCPLTIRWASTGDFGDAVLIELSDGDVDETAVIHSHDPSASGHGFAGEMTLDLAAYELEGRHYFRAHCRTDKDGEAFRAYTNPIWIDFDATEVAEGERVPLSLAPASNPFKGGTEIRFSLPEGGAARIEVFDVAGRRVALVCDAHLPAGIDSADWDGTDASGRRVSPGIYFFRLTHGGRSAASKGVLLR